ncbi:CDP-diacylglycerol--serine O-phosphatidyltransferase [Cupriavidus necator]|uniref:CDP-diacylglycerol--serine O-phosphatidyltransferase n=1 Tax=Cupriavidus necator (strain ATCC 17699 / DSM 428 / KCTC 22496 / NCIMB 10442 / H16 / Stanier 337) TaxID=381666 RepID=Q0KCU0_CUPNH|nr:MULTISPECIES: CDP-diacylglycerol--serine O-phosphatidyltransferase [Cupriavidus]EON21754.1 CDP-diacylglycerol--serine O-phosphatidyltransferase [Cupriavidus sp. GA3-3]KUE85196.1 CDP-diacylglycerol--serine O-phosphatidyltransferase [Cupriavidus necator]QCC00090.1 CDP-diacylglycerol--serine O-phosphatidyltransferase [Cupriavidus necator H16]QQB77096.1 CDP-diacylglycerol--serine O-phosphatidyltransferase [Cupriavidus necator]WKA41943.1 CDP-diacylglycerol--serine O-phosphatidyltransferase [Cupr
MVAFHRRNKRSSSGNVTHLRPFRHNQLRGADDNFDDEAADDHDIVYQRPRRRGIYLLPNAFTTAALFAGFFAIVQAMNMRFDAAAIAIFAAMVLDGMDGRVARITNTQSAFGEQYDSLSDMTSFGVAPALVMYEWILHDLGKWGWIAAFVYCTCAALRLARFNANIGVVDKRFFQGLPSPAAAALVAGFVWLVIDNKLPVKELWMPWVAFGITLYAGLSMVSNAPFYSGKALDVRYRVPFGMMVLVLVLFVVVSTDPPVALFGLFVAYAISGYVLWAWRAMHGKPAIEKKQRENGGKAS